MNTLAILDHVRLRVVTALVASVITIGVAHGGSATLTIESVGAEPGETVRVPVRLSSDDLVGAFDFIIDASDLTVASVDYNGPLFSAGWDGWDTTPAVAAQVTGACIFPEDQVTGHDLPLLDLLIAIPPDAASSTEIAVGISWAQISDYSFVPYDVTIVPGTIVIVSAGCDEDVDGDGAVGFADMLAVIAAWGPCGTACLPDVDADGVVGLADLLRVLAGWGPC